jgi:hypothetical protein
MTKGSVMEAIILGEEGEEVSGVEVVEEETGGGFRRSFDGKGGQGGFRGGEKDGGYQKRDSFGSSENKKIKFDD